MGQTRLALICGCLLTSSFLIGKMGILSISGGGLKIPHENTYRRSCSQHRKRGGQGLLEHKKPVRLMGSTGLIPSSFRTRKGILHKVWASVRTALGPKEWLVRVLLSLCSITDLFSPATSQAGLGTPGHNCLTPAPGRCRPSVLSKCWYQPNKSDFLVVLLAQSSCPHLASSPTRPIHFYESWTLNEYSVSD